MSALDAVNVSESGFMITMTVKDFKLTIKKVAYGNHGTAAGIMSDVDSTDQVDELK